MSPSLSFSSNIGRSKKRDNNEYLKIYRKGIKKTFLFHSHFENCVTEFQLRSQCSNLFGYYF